MNLIASIEISYFRSFSEIVKITNCKDLNIFSGKNDSGKSNILRALNLFFSENKIDFYIIKLLVCFKIYGTKIFGLLLVKPLSRRYDEVSLLNH